MKILAESDKLIRRSIIASGIFTLLLFLLPVVLWARLSEELPLLYSLPWGEGQIVNKSFLFALGGVSLLFIAINIFLTKVLDGEILLRRILWAGCAFSILLALITLVRIILLF